MTDQIMTDIRVELNKFPAVIERYNINKFNYDKKLNDMIEDTVIAFINLLPLCDTIQQVQQQANIVFDPAIAQEIINALESANVEIENGYSPEYINDFRTKLNEILTKHKESFKKHLQQPPSPPNSPPSSPRNDSNIPVVNTITPVPEPPFINILNLDNIQLFDIFNRKAYTIANNKLYNYINRELGPILKTDNIITANDYTTTYTFTFIDKTKVNLVVSTTPNRIREHTYRPLIGPFPPESPPEPPRIDSDIITEPQLLNLDNIVIKRPNGVVYKIKDKNLFDESNNIIDSNIVRNFNIIDATLKRGKKIKFDFDKKEYIISDGARTSSQIEFNYELAPVVNPITPAPTPDPAPTPAPDPSPVAPGSVTPVISSETILNPSIINNIQIEDYRDAPIYSIRNKQFYDKDNNLVDGNIKYTDKNIVAIKKNSGEGNDNVLTFFFTSPNKGYFQVKNVNDPRPSYSNIIFKYKPWIADTPAPAPVTPTEPAPAPVPGSQSPLALVASTQTDPVTTTEPAPAPVTTTKLSPAPNLVVPQLPIQQQSINPQPYPDGIPTVRDLPGRDGPQSARTPTASILDKYPLTMISTLDKNGIQSIQTDDLNQFTKEQIQKITPKQFTFFTQNQINAFTPQQIKYILGNQLVSIVTSGKTLTRNQNKNITPTVRSSLLTIGEYVRIKGGRKTKHKNKKTKNKLLKSNRKTKRVHNKPRKTKRTLR